MLNYALSVVEVEVKHVSTHNFDPSLYPECHSIGTASLWGKQILKKEGEIYGGRTYNSS